MKMAPADEYFGKLKLSFLGINNTFRDTSISAGAHTTDAALARKIDFAIDALNDWQRKFPHDPQLARTYFLAQITLKKLWLEPYQDKAWAYMQHIVAAYPATFYGRTVKADIARGFTRHYYAPAVPCDAAATPAPSVTTDNGKYKTTIETPPCVTPSPSPSPSPEPTLAPAAPLVPAPSLSPGATPSPAPAGVPSAVPPASPGAVPPASPAGTPPAVPAATPAGSSPLPSPAAAPSPSPAVPASPPAVPATPHAGAS